MTDGMEPTVEQQSIMADYIEAAVVRDATGEAEGDRCVGEPPSARYYLATLAPEDLDLSAGRERRGRETPRAAGVEFEVADDRPRPTIPGTVSCYYGAVPASDDQLTFPVAD